MHSSSFLTPLLAAAAGIARKSPQVTFIWGVVLVFLLFYYLGTADHRRKKIIGTVLTVLVTCFCLWAIDAGNIFVGKPLNVKLGMDLAGGSEFTVRLKPGKNDQGEAKKVTPDSVQQAIGILEKRLNPEGAKDLLLAPQGDDRILIQMPGVKPDEVADVKTKLEQTAHLEFRLVHPQSTTKLLESKASGTPVFGWVEMRSKEHKEDPKYPESYLVSSRPDLEGRYVNGAFVSFDTEGWAINLNFNSEGAELFYKLTAAHVNEQLAIIVDDEVLSAPNLREAIAGGHCRITGKFKEKEARALATALENPLENPMEIIASNSVSAQFGQQTIQQGILTGIVGTVLVAIFMVIYYRFAGLIALAGLIVSVLMMFGAMSLFDFTLTMPGIAGIVLTVGMAVDANVLIYERLREEMRAGKTLAGALETAFSKAFSAIFDVHVTTLVSSVILFYLASGLVKGFAITLTTGVIGTLFGALLVTRVVFFWFIDSGKLTKISVTQIIPNRTFDMLSWAKPFIIGSSTLAVIAILTFVVKGKEGIGIDFRGGSIARFEMTTGQVVTTAEVEEELKKVGVHGAYVQENTSATGKVISIRSDENDGDKVKHGMDSAFHGKLTNTSADHVGSVVGKELAVRSTIAYFLAMALIFAYLVMFYEFSFAVGAIIALFHDCVIAIGLSVLFGQQLSIIHIGALLTIAGYSVNDTIIVFDRIREMIRTHSGNIRDLMNEAISITLSRTLLTSLTVLIPMVVLLIFGGPAMKEFSLPILIGVIVGTYSSIYIASPLVLWWSNLTGKSLRRQVLDRGASQVKTPTDRV
jgi:SecD/SecF fusion protein